MPLVDLHPGTYLVTGGTGGLGRLVVEQAAVAGAGHIVIACRRPVELEGFIARIESLGTAVSVWEVDVSDKEDMARCMSRLRASGPPLRGVLHLAGQLADRTIESIEAADLKQAFGPKVNGSWNLHELTAQDELDFFFSFSSLAAALGSPGQACYAGANAFIDVLTEARNRAGLPALSLQWGPWGGAGMAARNPAALQRLTRVGVNAIALEEGLELLRVALVLQPRGVVVAAKMNWETYARELLDTRLSRPLPLASTGSPLGGEGGALRAELRALENERPELIVRRVDAYVRERVLAASGSTAISEHDSFFELGLDSLQAVSVRARIERDLEVSLAPSVVFDFPTLATLRDHLLYDHLRVPRVREEVRFGSSGPRGGATHTSSADAGIDAATLLSELEAGMLALEKELGQ